ncbi:hypothetical protein PspLS_07462, partial [Pyricularia sp. CBS 133598]
CRLSATITQLGTFTVFPGALRRAPSSDETKEWSYDINPDRIYRIKRAQEGGMNDNSDEDRDEDRGEEKSFKQPRQITEGKRLACPYYKHDPQMYSLCSYTQDCCDSCWGPGWPSVHRLKEHLYSKHQISNSCNRCFRSFTSNDDLHTHMVARESCRVRTRDPCKGFTQREKERLESVGCRRNGAADTNKAHQWWWIYGILFPGVAWEDYPSPYYEDGMNCQPTNDGSQLIVSSPHERRDTPQPVSDDFHDEHDRGQTFEEGHEDEEDQDQEEADDISAAQNATVDRLMTFFFDWFNSDIGATTSNSGHGSTSSDSGSSDQSTQQTVARVGNLGAARNGCRNPRRPVKRRQDDDDGDRDEYNTQEKRPKIEAPQARKLACPFYKHSPRRYKGQSSGNRSSCCRGPGWHSMHRLKEHIYRCHRLPDNVCIRCSKRFADEKELGTHTKAPEGCNPYNDPLLDFKITPDQVMKLRSRKSDPEATSSAQKWVKMYRDILFPDTPHDETPSPFYEDEDVEKEDRLEGFKAYIRRELPPLVRAWLEKEVDLQLNPNEDELKPRVIEIALKLQIALFEIYLKSEESGAPRAKTDEPETAESAAPDPGTDVGAVDEPQGLLGATEPADVAAAIGECGAWAEDVQGFTFDGMLGDEDSLFDFGSGL